MAILIKGIKYMVYDFFEEIKDLINGKIKNFYSKFKYLLLFIAFITFLLCIFLCEKVEPDTIESQQIRVLGITIENWAQWITIIALPYTAGWAFYQFKKNNSAKKQEKAVQIGKEFSNKLIDKCGIINDVFRCSSLNQILKFDEKNYDDFRFFNVDELRRIYKDDNFPTIYADKLNNSIQELDDIYHERLIKGVTPYIDKTTRKIKVDINKNKIEEIQEIKNINPYILQNKDLPYHFFDLVSDVLNQLEYMCMDISSKATDSRYIYQSLHQMFLRTVRTLAVDISVDNKNFSDKYYTNIIHVYNDWTTRYIKDLKIEKRKKEKINKILNPKIKTV